MTKIDLEKLGTALDIDVEHRHWSEHRVVHAAARAYLDLASQSTPTSAEKAPCGQCKCMDPCGNDRQKHRQSTPTDDAVKLADDIEKIVAEFGEASLPIIGEHIGLWRHNRKVEVQASEVQTAEAARKVIEYTRRCQHYGPTDALMEWTDILEKSLQRPSVNDDTELLREAMDMLKLYSEGGITYKDEFDNLIAKLKERLEK